MCLGKTTHTYNMQEYINSENSFQTFHFLVSAVVCMTPNKHMLKKQNNLGPQWKCTSTHNPSESVNYFKTWDTQMKFRTYKWY
jgi:hypothetical protein